MADSVVAGPGPAAGRGPFPVGAAVTVAELDGDPHPLLARLRAAEPASWLPVIGGWLVTRRDLAERVLRDPARFTVDDPRFTTARVVGPSMLSLDGARHRRHRDPFAGAFRARDVSSGLASFTAGAAGRLVAALAPAGRAELRRGLAGPLAVAVMAEALGLTQTDPVTLLSWYDAIVAGVSALTEAAGGPDAGDDGPGKDPISETGGRPPVPAAAAQAFGALAASIEASITGGPQASLLAVAAATAGLSTAEIVSNAAVMLFGGIETTEGMISNAAWQLLGDPGQLGEVLADRELVPGAVEESLRLEPAAAVVDRFATADVQLGGAPVRAGDLVRVSLSGANRDPAHFPDPDRFDVRRANARQHLAFALGPHYCVAAHLARLEATAALSALLAQLPGLRLDPARRSAPGGLVFRKPATVHVLWA